MCHCCSGLHSSRPWSQAVWPEPVLLGGCQPPGRREMPGCVLTVPSAQQTGQEMLWDMAQGKQMDGTPACFLLVCRLVLLSAVSFFLSASPLSLPPSLWLCLAAVFCFPLPFLLLTLPRLLSMTLRGFRGQVTLISKRNCPLPKRAHCSRGICVWGWGGCVSVMLIQLWRQWVSGSVLVFSCQKGKLKWHRSLSFESALGGGVWCKDTVDCPSLSLSRYT